MPRSAKKIQEPSARPPKENHEPGAASEANAFATIGLATGPEQGRVHNLRVILDAARQCPGSTRPELARLTGLTVQSVHTMVDELLGRGLLLVSGRRKGGRGQPASELALNPAGAYSIGLHLDRDQLTGVLTDLEGKVLTRISQDLRHPSPEETLPQMVQMVQDLRRSPERGPEGRVWGVGVALPGPLNLGTGVIHNPPNFPGWDGVNVRDALEREIGRVVSVIHDGAAAALGERWYGAGRAYHSFFYVYSGIGLGSGVIIAGRTFAGTHGNVNFGHIPVRPGGLKCSCGARGCVEMYASMQALYTMLREQDGLQELSVTQLGQLYRDHHPTVDRWLAQATETLAPALSAAIHLLGPEAVVFGGRLPHELQADLLGQLRAELSNYRMVGMPATPLVAGEITTDAASLGAATLPIYLGMSPGTSLDPPLQPIPAERLPLTHHSLS